MTDNLKTIDTLVDDIYRLFTEGADVSPEHAEQLGKNIARVILSRLSQAKEERKEYLRLSNIGKQPIHLWYKLNGYAPEPMEPHTHLKFLIGDIQEEVLLFLAKVAGHRVEGEQDEIVVDGVVGHRDAVIDGYTVDVKTASSWSFKHKFKEHGLFDEDSFGYIPQLSAYCQGEVTDGVEADCEDGAFLVSNKETGEIFLLLLPSMAQPNVKRLVSEVRAAVEADEPPPIPDHYTVEHGKSGNIALAPAASYDSMKRHIFPDLRLFLYKSGYGYKPTYFTHVVNEPRVPEIDMETGEIINKEDDAQQAEA